MTRRLLLGCCLVAAAATTADHPTAKISNGLITARLYTPDAVSGYYRGTRFDWSGVVYSLTYKGHEYFGEWQDASDPLLHDHITGPVEEFRTAGKGLGYDEAPAGGRFIRIGVGVCEKPAEDDYRWSHTYKVLDPGKWTVTTGGNWIEFTHVIGDGNGYAYRYVKRLTLTPGSPELVLHHTLENTGVKPIQTDVYNHNFFVIDKQRTGPDFVVRFPFELIATRDMKGIAAVRGRELRYLKEVPDGSHVSTPLEGFGTSRDHNRFEIENTRVKAGVRMATDKPLVRLFYWSPRTTLCPEPYIALEIEPGQSDSWTTRYEFYTTE